MKEFYWGGSRVEVDAEATANWYKRAAEWDCPCEACRNFIALAKGGLLPQSVLQALQQLSIPPEKATYVCNLYDDLYQFSYRVVGNILNAPEKSAPHPGEGYCCHEIYPYGAPDFPEPHFDLAFTEQLPWILEAGPRK